MKNIDRVDVLSNSENANSYITKSILDYALDSGCSVNEVAKMACVSRATIHNWTHGHQARYVNLSKIIIDMELEDTFPEKIFHLSRLASSFDAKDIRLYHMLSDELNKLSVAIKESIKVLAVEKLVTPPSLNCMALWGRKLIDCALLKKFNLDLLLLPIGYVDLKSESLIDDYERFSAELELELNSSNIGCYVLELLAISNIEDEILEGLSLPEREYLNELLSKKIPVKHFQLDWGYGNSGNEFQWFLEWLSDYDGQAVISTLFKEIRVLTSQKKNKLELYVMSVERYISESRDEFLKGIYENLSTEDQLSFNARDYLYDYECPIELYREHSSYIYDEYEIPISPAMVKFFFNTMGFQAVFNCDEPSVGEHKVVLSW